MGLGLQITGIEIGGLLDICAAAFLTEQEHT